ncbi:MAG: hypothetical protein RMJ19_00755 [Gemmatales bacterium]|nr:hypothetical protein [Gemmatales bacterium]MDW8174174.1 hypothetical protein [Gemmatales bacterium]
MSRDIYYCWLDDDWLMLEHVRRFEVYDLNLKKVIGSAAWQRDDKLDWYLDQNTNVPTQFDESVSFAFLTEGKDILVTLHDNGLLRYWRTKDWTLVKTLATALLRQQPISSFNVQLTPDRKYLAVRRWVGKSSDG